VEVYPAVAPMLGFTDDDGDVADPDPNAGEVVPPVEPPVEKPAFTLSDIRVILVEPKAEMQLSILEEDVGKITWKISDETVAKVSSDGLLTAGSIGSTVVTATDKDGFSVQCEVLCVWDAEDIITAKLSLSMVDFTLKIDESYAMSIIGTDAEAVWTSDDESVATVSSSGIVTNVGGGKTLITASVGGQTLESIVRCKG